MATLQLFILAAGGTWAGYRLAQEDLAERRKSRLPAAILLAGVVVGVNELFGLFLCR